MAEREMLACVWLLFVVLVLVTATIIDWRNPQ